MIGNYDNIGGSMMTKCNIQNCYCKAVYVITYQHTPKTKPRKINICENCFNGLNKHYPEKILNKEKL